MKKLVSLVSVLTISGTFIPITIAASHYPNQEETNAIIIKDNKNNNIYYQQTNNLENLIRKKDDHGHDHQKILIWMFQLYINLYHIDAGHQQGRLC